VLELVAREVNGRVQLVSPGVGWFSGALARGESLTAGAHAGFLWTLGVRRRLVVPSGIEGSVGSKPPAKTRAPVGYGDVLYEVVAATSARSAAAPTKESRSGAAGELVVRASQAGRFYHRSAPGEPLLCAVGRELEVGTPIGLIEVMKTFTQVVYRPERDMPAKAKILRVLAADAADVDQGAALIAIAPRE